jgi:formylglycine-generating enzyme required for sulfatase activity
MLVAFAVGAACDRAAPPRPQLIVFIDTDAHLVGELSSRPEVSHDAAIDTLRVEALGASDQVYESNVFYMAEALRWPLSFGVVPPPDGAAEVHLRIRAFRASQAREQMLDGAAILDPPKEVTIDRLAWIPTPTSGVTRVQVLLAEDCLGTPSSLATPATCVDAGRPADDPHEGVEPIADTPPSSRAGTWPAAVERPCTVPADADGGPVCIKGGFTILGDYDAVGANAGDPYVETVPLRPVIVRPFLLDQTEFTVQRFRLLVSAGALSGAAMPMERGAGDDAFCTWLGVTDVSNDTLPLNCVPYETATQVCAYYGGKLPTEAQWEHAARGRGEGRRYPWGDQNPTCCAVSASRPPTGTECTDGGGGVEPVKSHGPASCPLSDVSKDGIYDMAGSLAEALQDVLAAYSDRCWGGGVGILGDQPCSSSILGLPAARGDDWTASLGGAWVVLRHPYSGGRTSGFRCAYSGEAP